MTVKRSDIDRTSPPRKPPRTNSVDSLDNILEDQTGQHLKMKDGEQERDNITPQHSENTVIENNTKMLQETNNIEVEKVTDLHQQEEPQEKPQEEHQEEPQEKPQEEPQEEPQEKPQEEPQEEPQEKPQEEPQEEPQVKPQEEPQEEPQEKPQKSEGIVHQKAIDLPEKNDSNAEFIPQEARNDENNVSQFKTTGIPLQEATNNALNIIEQSADLVMSTEATLSTELTSPSEVVSVDPVPTGDVPVIASNQNQVLPTNQPNSDINSQSNGTNMEIHQTDTHEFIPPQPLPTDQNQSNKNLGENQRTYLLWD